MTRRSTHRALVVDDELAVQKLLVLSLRQRGFQCDSAADGLEAEERLAGAQYDLVITDLKMPNKHGHALATQLLALDERPVIIVHTGVIEPRLARDLLNRGVDDILFKPIDFNLLAAKAIALVERRQSSPASNQGPARSHESPADEERKSIVEDSRGDAYVTLSVLENKLSGLSRILPISKAAMDVYNMASAEQVDTGKIAATIQRDATLAAEIMRLANSAFYNPSTQLVTELERAVLQIGQKRIGELALATNALTALTSGLLPWMDVGLAWRRSLAAGVAIEMLIERGRHDKIEEGLLLSAIMHPLGRVVLGSLFPKQYEMMIEQCKTRGESLNDQERHVFPMSHTEVVAQLLATWNVPPNVHLPLKFLLAEYASIAKVPEPRRTRAELLKLAIFAGELAIGSWESWDSIDIPPSRLLDKLDIRSISQVVERIKANVEVLAKLRTDRLSAAEPAGKPTSGPACNRELAYCDLANDPFDTIPRLLFSMGIEPVVCAENELGDMPEKVLVNCVGIAPHRLAARAKPGAKNILLVADAERPEFYGAYGRVIILPESYGNLKANCREAAVVIDPTSKAARAPMPDLAEYPGATSPREIA